MISADTIATLEQQGLEYIPGAHERTSSVIRDIVLDRQRGETQLWAKEVKVGKDRSTVNLNEQTA